MIVVAILAGALGSVIGSFLNVVVYRVPAGRSVVTPASACGSCGHEIRARDNIPVLSWLVLRGRCRDCAAPISIRYPLVEAGTALLFVAVALRFAFVFTDAAAIATGVLTFGAFAYLASISVALGLIDADTRTLPNRIVLPAYLVGAALLAGASLLAGDPSALLRAAAGLGILGGLYLVIALVSGGMGLGDVKLAGVLGMYLGWLGWDALAVGGIAGFVLGGLWGVGLLVTRRARRGSSLPFGPWMLGGAWSGVLWGTPIAEGYLGLIGVH
jgi:leader peptidase (prepilin peptidase)/N-methyltransferase